MAKIVIVDDHLRVRGLLRRLLEEQPDLEVLGEADDGLEGLELVRKLRPDVVITDLKMHGMDGLEFTRELVGLSSSIGVIVLTMYGEPLYAMQAMDAGAMGYVLKGSDFDELIQAIREVTAGRRYVSPELSAEAAR